MQRLSLTSASFVAKAIASAHHLPLLVPQVASLDSGSTSYEVRTNSSAILKTHPASR